jgi:hypothetical protein
MITRYDPNTIFLGGEHTQIGDLAGSEPIVPGMLVERFHNAGVIRFRRHATAGGPAAHLVALNHSMANKGVDDPYATGDLLEVSAGRGGSTYWALLASGQTIVAGNKLESAGDGTLRLHAAGTPLFSSLENKTTTGFGRCRVEVI